ncbi:hypothetical protein FRB99_000558 [Tulasnella sp. 403]|nr:hypothetical protein FRB99_000558 [Tulasnella sp. 403]
MATPASQKTTPSPQLSSSSQITLDATTASSRKRPLPEDGQTPDIDAFLRRAHYGKLARELRARLSYASFKTSHNMSHLSFNTLEQQFAAKPRPSPSTFQHPISPRQRLSHAQMMPPPPSPRNNSLYTALLGSAPIPPNKRARHGQTPNQPTRQSAHSSVFLDPHGTRNIHNLRPDGISSSEPDEINAAATLTSLLLNRPGSRSEGSSLSRTSSSASVTAFAQSQPSSQLSQTVSGLYRTQSTASTSAIAPPPRLKTPQPDDAQAAELMLFLATSPSPARSTHSRTRSEGRPGQLLSKARVLFGSTDNPVGIPRSPRGTSSVGGPPQLGPPIGASLTTTKLLPPPPSPGYSKSHFDIGEFIKSSPSPTRPTATSKPSFKGEGRRLFAEDDDALSASKTRVQSGSLFPGSSVPLSNPGVKADTGILGMSSAPVLGPAMGANG